MSFLETLLGVSVEEHEGEMVNLTGMTQTLRPGAAKRQVQDWRSYGTAHRQNAIIRACVKELSESVAPVEPVVELRKGATSHEWERAPANHPLQRLLSRPSASNTTFEFLETVIQDLSIFGNVFIWKIRTGKQRPGALEVLRPHLVEPWLDRKNNTLLGIKYHRSGVLADTTNVVDIRKEDYIHLKYPDPLDTFWGLAPLASASSAEQLDDDAISYLRAFFTNAATPQGILKFKGRVRQVDRERARESWVGNFAGKVGWHSTAVMDQDADYQDIGTRPDKLKLDQIFDTTESRLCMVFGVPPIVVAVRLGLMKSTYSNYEQARTSLWEETLAPFFTRTDQKFTVDLGPEFRAETGQEVRVRFDLSAVEELQKGKESRREFARLGWDTGILTRNEARSLVDLKPLSDELGEVIRVKNTEIGVVPVGSTAPRKGVVTVDPPPAASGGPSPS